MSVLSTALFLTKSIRLLVFTSKSIFLEILTPFDKECLSTNTRDDAHFVENKFKTTVDWHFYT